MKNSLLLSLLLFSIPVLGLPKSIRNQDGSLPQLEEMGDLNSMILALPHESIATENVYEQISLLHDKDGFMVTNSKTMTRVNQFDVDPELRNMDPKEAAVTFCSEKLRVTQLDDGQYRIAKHGRPLPQYKTDKPTLPICKGVLGGMIGFWIGKGSVYVAGHGSIIGAGVAAGPWGFCATVIGLEIKYAALIEVTSNTAGHTCAVFALFATGPA